MPIGFPLDKIPMIPPVLTSVAVDKLVDFLNKLIDKLLQLVDEATELPDDCACDDPRVQKIKDGIDEVMALLQKIQALIPKLQEYIDLFKLLADVASAIKNSIYLIPIVGQAVLAADLNLVQTMTIENAKKSLQQLQSVPGRLGIGIDLAVEQISKVASRLAVACSGAENGTGTGSGAGDGTDNALLLVPQQIKDSLDAFDQDFNDLLPSDFYQLKNVTDEDIDLRSDLIKELIDQQRDLLASLNDAPAEVISGNGPPNNTLGKSGDFYIDILDNNKTYGPKVMNQWIVTNDSTVTPGSTNNNQTSAQTPPDINNNTSD